MKNAILLEGGFLDMSLLQTILVCAVIAVVGVLICLGISAIRKAKKKNKDEDDELED